MALNAVSSTNNAPEPKMLEFGPATVVTPEEAMDMDPSRWAKVKMPHIKERGMGGWDGDGDGNGNRWPKSKCILKRAMAGPVSPAKKSCCEKGFLNALLAACLEGY